MTKHLGITSYVPIQHRLQRTLYGKVRASVHLGKRSMLYSRPLPTSKTAHR